MSQRITAIEYIRGIAMLGVVGIHTGAYSLGNPDVNIHLFALLEILSRFSVPIFFFVSAFGLFLHHNLTAPFDYRQYLWRRCRTVLIPYLSWSLLYMAHESWLTDDYWQWSAPYIYEHLLFGHASYQLYFLVILIWFYALMPLWRAVLPRLLAQPVRYLTILLVFQIAFNYYSSYYVHADSDNYYINQALQHRLSYLPLHYVFTFLLGALCALRFTDCLIFVNRYRTAINMFFASTAVGMLIAYYWLLLVRDYTPEQAVGVVHQLNPIGVLYTFAASLFFLSLFSHHGPIGKIAHLLEQLSCHSYAVYLVHPLVMYYLADYIAGAGLAITVPVVVVFYSVTVAISLCFGVLLQKASRLLPLIGMLLTGTYPTVKKIKVGM